MAEPSKTIDGDGSTETRWSVPCSLCKNLLNEKLRTCKAFRDGIPDVIWEGDNFHLEPFKGDNGIQFDPVDDTEDSDFLGTQS